MDAYEGMIQSLRAMEIDNSKSSRKKKRIESTPIDTCSVNGVIDSGKLKQSNDKIVRLQPERDGGNKTRSDCSLPPDISNRGSVIDMEDASSMEVNIINSAVEYTTTEPESNAVDLRSNCENVDGRYSCAEKTTGNSLGSDSVSRCNTSKEKKVANGETQVPHEDERETTRQVGRKSKEKEAMDAMTDCLMSLFLSQSKLSLQELTKFSSPVMNPVFFPTTIKS
jgi:hypothetical protein